MTLSARRRILAGVLAGASLALAGCTVPGQPAPAGAAATYENTTISNEIISAQMSAWQDEAGQVTNRRAVVTAELLREPLLEVVEELDLTYHRSMSERQARAVLQANGVTDEPSEAMVDAVEATFLVAVFGLAPELTDILLAVAAEVEAQAITSPRVGEFSAQRFVESLGVAHEQASTLASQEMPVWFIAFREVNGFTVAGAEWLASDAAVTQ